MEIGNPCLFCVRGFLLESLENSPGHALSALANSSPNALTIKFKHKRSLPVTKSCVQHITLSFVIFCPETSQGVK